MDASVVGVLGGGQLGRMMAQAASRLGVPLVSLDAHDSPTAQVSQPHLAHPHFTPALTHANGSFSDAASIEAFSRTVDVLTVEIEHVNVDILKKIARDPAQGRQGQGCKVYPSADVIEVIQDKWKQKRHLVDASLPTTECVDLPESSDVNVLVKGAQVAGQRIGYPFMLKSRLLAYDGRGNAVVKSESSILEAIEFLTPKSTSVMKLYAEKFADFSCEIAVLVVQSANGDVRVYPPVETIHENNICHIVHAPLRKGGPSTAKKAVQVAQSAVRCLGNGAVGVFGVEMFLMPNDDILINEIAPRPHNSYHHTIASTPLSQFSAHLLAILSHPLPPQQSFELVVPSAAMLNILGASDGQVGVDQVGHFVKFASTCSSTSIELYGKQGCRRGRKMGHVNVVGSSDAQVYETLAMLVKHLPNHTNDDKLCNVVTGFSHSNPIVSIVMGSDSDLPNMIAASRILSLEHFQIPHELSIVSAHRTPTLMTSFGQEAASRGIKVIIAGAGGSAHLPGMLAALTALPVIGVPIKGSSLDGVDSLHSMVQMPRGIPVATVAINNSTNAALLAIRMLSCGQPRLIKKMEEYMYKMEQEVMMKREKMSQVGWEEYKVAKS